MLQIQGIADYERFSLSGGKSRREEKDGAEFEQLMPAGKLQAPQGLSAERVETGGGELFALSGTDAAVYDGFGKMMPGGATVGRNINVAI